jgi:hypothetical protein
LSVGSVPLYQAFVEAIRKYGAGVDMPEDDQRTAFLYARPVGHRYSSRL